MVGFDWRRLAGKAWLGFNRAAVHRPSIAFVADTGMRVWIQEHLASWLACPMRVFHRHPDQPSLRDLDPGCVEYARLPHWSVDLDAGLGFRNSSAFAALNLLDLLGYDPIYLIGIDMVPEGGVYRTWYAPPVEDGGHAMPHVLADLEVYAQPRASVVNLNPASGVRRWSFGDLDAALEAV